MDCIFCKIARGEIKSDVVSQDGEIVVIRDIHPQAPVHMLVIPMEHLASVADIDEGSSGLIGRMALRANAAAAGAGVAERGYRLVINCRSEGGQSVDHLHMHILGGRALNGQMG